VTALLLAPHYDDEILFAAYTLMRERPQIAWVFPPRNHLDHLDRRGESHDALLALGISFASVQTRFESVCYEGALGEDAWPYGLVEHLHDVEYDMVYAPAPHDHGHHEHNVVGRVALDTLGAERVTWYQTYTRTKGRQKYGNLVEPDPDMIARKLRALACFTTQIAHPARRPWFYELLDMREWHA
jgi:LmbE family N-acetylglucosaminyl deacetylase